MKMSKTLVVLAVAAAVLSGCRNPQPEPSVAVPAAEASTAPVDNAPAPVAEPVKEGAIATAPTFDITAITLSDTPLPEWPYVALPAGYHFDNADNIARASKDLARVPLWTGTELLWLEGRTFTDDIEKDEGKSFSKFEVRKNLQQSIEALGGKRLTRKVYDEATYKTHQAEIEDFRQEFSDMADAYWYDNEADTYVIRRADKAIWVVTYVGNDDASLMVAEGPLPVAPAK